MNKININELFYLVDREMKYRKENEAIRVIKSMNDKELEDYWTKLNSEINDIKKRFMEG